MYFDLPKTHIYKAIVFKKTFSPSLIRFIKILFLMIGLTAGTGYLLTMNQEFLFDALKQFLPIENPQIEIDAFGQYKEYAQKYLIEYNNFLKQHAASYNLPSIAPLLQPQFWLNLFLILTPVGASLLFVHIFFEFYLKTPRPRDLENLAEFLDFDSAHIFNHAISISNRLKETDISTDSLFFAIVDCKPSQIIFMRLGVNPEQLKKLLSESLNLNFAILGKFSLLGAQKELSNALITLIADANKTRINEKRSYISMTDIMTSLFDLNPIFKQLVIDQDLDKQDLSTLSRWHEENKNYWNNKRKFWRLENLLKSPPIGVEWTYGYPLALARFTRDITVPFQKTGAQLILINREKELEQIQQILAQQNQANILLVGEEGVGKKAIVLKLAEKIYEGKALEKVNYKKVLELDVTLAASSSQYAGGVVNTLSTIFSEAERTGNIILFIQNIHNFVGVEEGVGRVDISAVLVPYLESPEIQIIATTDPISFHRYIATNSGVVSSFAKINIYELSEKDMFKIIADEALVLEYKTNLFFTYGAIKAVIEDAGKFFYSAPFPEKGLTLLNEVAGYVQGQRKNLVTGQDVHETVTKKTNIPLGTITTEERKKLINLDKEMHREIIGQERAVSVVVQAMQRLRSGLAKEGKPAGVFLFVGPTGVGKTLTAKLLAKHYFGAENRMVRFDMSEYQTKESISSLIGSIESNEPGRLITTVRENPFSVLLFDEVEKAHKDILNLFLQVFDEGWVTDAFGRKVSFQQNVIIATSNAGAEYIRQMIKQGIDPTMQKEKVIDVFISEGYFRPELLNRFDEIVIFHPLSRQHVKRISEILIQKLAERLKEKGYFYIPSQDIVDYISDIGFDPQFGARPMNRAIQDKLETVIARKILEGTIKKGQEFSLKLGEIE